MEQQWKILTLENCPNCGDELEVFSASLEKNDTNFVQCLSDGEAVRCISQCGFKSALSVDDDGEAWVQEGNINELPIFEAK
jgi:hypothetical protein